LKKFGKIDLKSAFPDFDENFSNFRVDPYDPYTIRFDLKATGTWTRPLEGKEPNGNKIISPAESGSLTFDDDGFCTRMTAGYVMDPTNCNTGGLGGMDGIFYAIGKAKLPVSTRPLPHILKRTQTTVLGIFTGEGADSFLEGSGKAVGTIITSKPAKVAFTPKPPLPTIPSVADSIPEIPTTDTLTSFLKKNREESSSSKDRIQEITKLQESVAAKRKAQQEAARAKADDAAKQRVMKMKTKQKSAILKKKAQTPKKAPPGVPVMKRWRKNRDGSITGFISGSNAFSAGEKVTTSPIGKGELQSGNVIQTQSGSKYFLY